MSHGQSATCAAGIFTPKPFLCCFASGSTARDASGRHEKGFPDLTALLSHGQSTTCKCQSITSGENCQPLTSQLCFWVCCVQWKQVTQKTVSHNFTALPLARRTHTLLHVMHVSNTRTVSQTPCSVSGSHSQSTTCKRGNIRTAPHCSVSGLSTLHKLYKTSGMQFKFTPEPLLRHHCSFSGSSPTRLHHIRHV